MIQLQLLVHKEAKRLNQPAAPFRLSTHIQHAMKPRNIFGLAVRLLGLFFLYLGLRAVSPMLDLETIGSADKSDIINAILPIVFNLVVAWWLLGGGWLIRRAYPEAPKISDHSRSQAERGTPAANLTRPQGLANMDRAEKRLAALVEKPKDGHAV